MIYYVFGAGGFGRETMPMVDHMISTQRAQEHPPRVRSAFLIDEEASATTPMNVNDHQVHMLNAATPVGGVAIAVGEPTDREAIDNRLNALGWFEFFNVQSQLSLVQSRAGVGNIIAHFAVVSPNVRLGDHVHINLHSFVAHDCIIGDYCTIGPHVGVCGNVKLGRGVYIGAGATIKPGVTIGDYATIGAGAVVIRDVPGGAVVVGNPSRVIATHNQHRAE